jgi:hypothetical protein
MRSARCSNSPGRPFLSLRSPMRDVGPANLQIRPISQATPSLRYTGALRRSGFGPTTNVTFAADGRRRQVPGWVDLHWF